MTDTSTNGPAPGHRGPGHLVRSALGTALRRATLATAAGLFLTVSSLGLWLLLPPLGRTAAVLVFAILTLAAAVPFIFVRVPAIAEGLRRLDHGSGLPHRPATAIVDKLAVTPSDSHSLALWNAHVARTLSAARTFKAGWPSPRVAARDPYAPPPGPSNLGSDQDVSFANTAASVCHADRTVRAYALWPIPAARKLRRHRQHRARRRRDLRLRSESC
ncbi:MAG TPA: DUF4175 family protein [Steroidobacteraceae bacterium]|nr:DUF4175 family protein [Steroidobacteraceae bacterium]